MVVQVMSLILVLIPLVTSLPEPEAGLGPEHTQTLSRMKRGGSCETTADCVGGNVCSKWGWCQWTTIYGEEGPSQGSSAPAGSADILAREGALYQTSLICCKISSRGGGRAGQCVTSKDCASRVPYCSKLGFCHGGRLPFDEEQLEIADQDKTDPFEKQPQGFINNNPAKNSPVVNGKSKAGGANNRQGGGGGGANAKQGGGGGAGGRPRGGTAGARQGGGGKRQQGRHGGSKKQSPSKALACPGGKVETCVAACEDISDVKSYTACVKTCSNRC